MNRKLPKGLSPKARAWWRDLTDEFVIEDAGGLLILEAVLRAFDRAEQARAAIDRDGAVVKDRFGQTVKHPAIAIERDARAQVLQGLKALNLEPAAASRARLGRPPGGRGM